MVKTTVYLEPDLAVRLKQLALTEGRPQAELIRDALADYAGKRKRPPIPGVGEFDSGKTDTSEKAEDILKRASRRGKWR
jgi:predicted transcriptional regulator